MVETDLLSAALKLSVKERARIAHQLILSLEDEPFEDQQEVDNAWAVEIKRRIAEFETGKVQGVPADKVFLEARAKIRNRRRR
jgi:putative addiction module component (TIGR02574 family)